MGSSSDFGICQGRGFKVRRLDPRDSNVYISAKVNRTVSKGLNDTQIGILLSDVFAYKGNFDRFFEVCGGCL
jgi:hypothetical protein